MDELSIAIARFDSLPITAISIALNYITYLALALVVVYLLLKKKTGIGTKLLITYLLLIVVIPTLKAVLGGERACVFAKIECPKDATFPSGHAAASAAALGAATFTRVFVPALAFHIAVALSRVYLGVHSLTDVFGGTVIGLAVYLAISQVYDSYAKVAKRKT